MSSSALQRVASWLLVLTTVGVAFAVWPSLHEPFSVLKSAIFISGAALVMAVGVLLRAKLPSHARPLLLAMAAYSAVVIVGAMASPLRYMTVHSSVFAIAGPLLFFGAACALRSNAGLYLKAMASVAAAVALIAMLQFFDFAWWRELGFVSGYGGRMRMFGTLGNPDFVSVFLCIALPANIDLALRNRVRWAWVASVAVICSAILCTASRAGLLALIVVGFIFAVLVPVSRVVRVALLITLVLVCDIGFTARMNARTPAEALRGRLFIWRVTLPSIRAFSALGTGPGTFSYVYPSKLGTYVGDPAHASEMRFAGNERHAENEIVEALQETGVLGALSLIVVFALWFRLAIRERHRPEVVSSIAAVSAFVTCAMFDFPLHRGESATLLWVWMALPFAHAVELPVRKQHWFKSRFALAVAACLVAIAVLPVLCSRAVAEGERAEERGDLAEAEAGFRRALRFHDANPDANFDLARVLAKQSKLNDAIAQCETALRFVDEPELWLLRIRILTRQGGQEKALRELRNASARFPYSAELQSELSSFLSTEGNSPANLR